jgi:hypothetical protein
LAQVGLAALGKIVAHEEIAFPTGDQDAEDSPM